MRDRGGQTGQWVNPRRSSGQRSPAFSRRRVQTRRRARKQATWHRFGRGLLHSNARSGAHLVVAVIGAGVAGKVVGDEVWRWQQLGHSWGGATEHERRRYGCLRAHEIVLGTMVSSKMSCGGCGHGYAMAGGKMLSGSKRAATTRRKRAGGKWGSKEKLMGSAAVVLGSSGKQRSGRTVAGDLGGPRLKKTAMAVLRCVPDCLTLRRGRG